MTWLAVVLVLAAGTDDSSAPRRKVFKPVAPAAQFEEPPSVPAVSDDARVRHFLGAFAGGVVGLGASVALIAAANGPVACAGMPFCAPNGGQVFLGALAPLVTVTSTWLGYQLLGGDGGWLTAAVMLVPGLLLGSGIVAIGSHLQLTTPVEFLPLLIGGGALLIGGSAIALHLRSIQLERLGAARGKGEAGAGRVALTSLVTVLTIGLTTLVALGGYALTPSTGGVVLATVLGLAGSVGVAAAAWGVHRGMGGRGGIGAALASLGLSAVLVAGAAGLEVATRSSPLDLLSPTVANVFSVQLLAACLLFAPTVALELSHTFAIEAALPRIEVSAAPLPQGGMIGATMRF